jgi:hypothetical protein
MTAEGKSPDFPCVFPENKNLSVGVYEKIVGFAPAGGEKNVTLLSAERSPQSLRRVWSCSGGEGVCVGALAGDCWDPGLRAGLGLAHLHTVYVVHKAWKMSQK